MRLLLFSIIFSYSLLAHATIYRWVDTDGAVHYSDTPHENADRLNIHSAPATSLLPQDAAEKPSDEDPNKPTPLAAGKSGATDSERCNEFSSRVKRYQDAGDMFIDNPDGTRHKLVDEERKNLIDRTQTQASQACEKAGE
jgi:hypothetical protein